MNSLAFGSSEGRSKAVFQFVLALKNLEEVAVVWALGWLVVEATFVVVVGSGVPVVVVDLTFVVVVGLVVELTLAVVGVVAD